MRDGDLSWLARELRELTGELNSAAADAPLLLSIDQGGHASRVIAFDIYGVQHAESFTPISTFRAGADRVEHDAHEIVESIRTALDDIAHTLGPDAARVRGAGIATQRSSIVCWDRRSGKPLSPVLSWQDRRNASLVEQLRSHAPRIRELTGLVLSPHYGASKLRWCLEELDAVGTARDHKHLGLGPLASFLMYSLLAQRPYAIDPANASRTQLWDPQSRNWSEELGELFGVPLRLMPSCMPTRHHYGDLTFAGRAIPLCICTGDQSAVPFAFGPIDSGTVYLNIGTGAFLQRQAIATDEQLLRSILYSDQHQTIAVLEGTVNGAAAALDWLNERIGIDTHRAALALTRASAAADAPLFINSIGGLGSPYWRGHVAPGFTGGASEALQVQAVVESIAFLIVKNLERMQVDGPAERIVASGGLAASNYLCECIAAVSGLQVERATLREATALGLAFLTGGQPPEWRPPVQFQRFAPVQEDALQARYQRWCAAMDAEIQ